jgi:hypothetical protein
MKIYISYRRADSQYVVGRIRDRLLAAFGENSVFTDVMDIPVGKDFREILGKEVRECDVMLVVIGPAWASLTDAEGNKRLFEPSDYIRTEIEVGLQNNKALVVPVLVMNASMPPSSELPESLKDLAFRNAISIRNDPDFDNDMQRLIRQIRQVERPVQNINPANLGIQQEKNGISPDQGVPVNTQGVTDDASTFQITLDQAVEDAQDYLTYLNSKSKQGIDEQTVDAIIKVRRLKDSSDKVDAKTEAEFWLAYQKLYELAAPFATNPQDFSTTSLTLEDESIEVETLYKGKTVARTTIKPDGDTSVTLPIQKTEDGSLVSDDFLLELHQKNVDAAVARRLEEVKQRKELKSVDKDKMQAARDANLLVNNRSQAVFNDQAQGEDQLGIKNEVEALAETLLLRDVEPPIAVGVMGGWGSGKSFVMYLISKYVEQTRCKIVKRGWSTQEKDPDVPAYVGHIYQINFNAWTYAKSNLWASLMDTIFTCLNRQMQLERLFAYQGIAEAEELPAQDVVNSCLMSGGDIFGKIYRDDYQIDLDTDLGDPEKKNLNFWSERLLSHNLLWQVMRNQSEVALQVMREDEQELEKYKARRVMLEQARQTESVVVSELDEKISRPAYFALLQTTLLSLVSDSLSKTTRDELKKSDLDPEELEELKKETETLIKGSRGLLYAVGKNKYFWLAGISVALLTLAFSYIWGLFGQSIIARVIAPAIAFVSAVAPFYPTLLTRWQNILEYETKTRKAFEDALEAQRTKIAEDIAAENITYAEKVKKLEDEVSKGSLPACDVLIRLKETRIEQQRRKIGPAARYATLMEFVQSRLDSATYENQLGLMHQVRRDIDELTYSLVSSANTVVFPRGKPRVILYIDDLDRCPPSRVVEILEAVQLLLNTKLFVVILGLDTRYVTRALEKEYKEILQHEGDPSGLDYIEKIIQIPYRVRPIEREWLRNYLEVQMDVEQPPEPEVPSAPQQQTQPDQPGSTAQVPPSRETDTQSAIGNQVLSPSGEPRTEATPPEPIISTPVEQPKPPEIELPAAVIQFKPTDLIDLNSCCEQVSLTPRSIKRVVNVFKLMKIFWFRADKKDQLRSVKQASICLLALSSAYPEIMREVFVHLEGLYRRGQGYMYLFSALNNIKLPPGSAHELAWQFQSYKQAVSTLKLIPGDEKDPLDQLTLETFKFSTFNLVRSFSFVGDPVYWSDDEEDKSRANGHVPAKRVAKVNRN